MSESSGYRLGVDVGGTFTDFSLFDEKTGEVWVKKVPTTPDDQTRGIIDGLTELLAQHGVAPEELLHLSQGSTIAINAILEGKTAPLGIITTRGFRDVLELRRQRRPSLYDLFFNKPLPLVPRQLRLEVPERIDAQGQVVVPLDEEKVKEALVRLAQAEVSGIVVCFLFSFLNPDHELRVKQLAREVAPDCPVWLSHQVLPEFREFERLGTTVCNAALGPVVKRYLGNLGARLSKLGYHRPTYVMQSNGGVVSPQEALERPANTLFSGPSAGVIGAVSVAGLTGEENIITLDMGGTSTDVCLVRRGNVSMVYEKEIAGTPVRAPMVDVNTIGAGGGSIAWVDAGGRLKVGPQSAGAEPGPAAYGQGGEEPTVTDADLVLGRLSPTGLLAGRIHLYPELAYEAILRRIAGPLALDTLQAALGIIEIVNSNTILATRAVSVGKGHDPREFTLVAYGGAGPMHASAVARALGIRRVLIPRTPGILCAIGLLATDMRTDYVQAVITLIPEADLEEINSTIRGLERRAEDWFINEGIGVENRVLKLSADLRYAGQNYELTVAAPPAPWNNDSLRKLSESLHNEHRRSFGYSMNKATVQLVNLRVTALASIPKLDLKSEVNETVGAATPFEHREVWWGDGLVSTPVYQRSRLPSGTEVNGPAILEQTDSTVLIAPGEQGKVDQYGNLILSL